MGGDESPKWATSDNSWYIGTCGLPASPPFAFGRASNEHIRLTTCALVTAKKW